MAKKKNGGAYSVLKGDMPKKQEPPKVSVQLLLTTILLASLAVISAGLFSLANLLLDTEQAQELLKTICNLPETLPLFVSDTWNKISEANVSLWPVADWFPTDEVNWTSVVKVEVTIMVSGIISLTMDLLFGKEGTQGSPRLLYPTFLLSLFYTVISLHSTVSRQFDAGIMLSLDAYAIGREIFSLPQTIGGSFSHILALDYLLAYLMCRDFYSRVSSRRKAYRLLMVLQVWTTCTLSLVMVPVYLVLRSTVFAAPEIIKARPLNTNRNSYRRELDYLLDPIPGGSGALMGWVRYIPSPWNVPITIAVVIVGIIRFFAMLALYLFYVTFFCLPVSAVFFSLRRTWLLSRGHTVMGVVYSVFEPFDGRKYPLKAVVVVTGHLRLMCFKNNNSTIFNVLIGSWLHPLLSAFVMYEFTVPFKKSFAPYCAFMMEEFGPVFPMGAGLGFGSYADVKHIMENPKLRKGGLSLAWSISEAQNNWSANNLTTHPRSELHESLVAEGRELVRCWLKDVNKNLNDPIVRKRLDAILPLANVDGTPVDQTLVEISFGSTLFHLLTGGEFTAEERKHYHKLLTNAFPFLSDYINKIWFGGILQYLGIQDYDMMRRAFLRYLAAPSLQNTLALASSKWDAWSPPEIVRFLVYKFSIAGGAAPAFLLSAIVNTLFENPEYAARYRKLDKRGKRKMILEIARLERCVPLVNFSASDFTNANGEDYITIHNQKIPVPDGTPLHCSVQSANRDVRYFGADAEVLNFDRPDKDLGNMMTFNGNDNDIVAAMNSANPDPNKPVRRCPGYDYALNIIEFLVDRFLPPDHPPVGETKRSLDEITEKASYFMRFVLKRGRATYDENNQYFPHASEVLHPMDTAGNHLGSRKVIAAGGRTIPQYDEDVPKGDMLKDGITGLVLRVYPITDDDGEWESPEQAVLWRMNWFSSNFPPVNCFYDGDKIESSANKMMDTMSGLAFSGLCCLHTKRDKDGIGYVNDNTLLGSYRVRRGYQRYGAAAYFDSDYNIVGVYTSHDEKYHKRPAKLKSGSIDDNLEKPEYAEWRHAMWVWRVSSMAQVTVADHLVNVHMVAANTLVSASRRHLPINHPLRAFLKIFTFRSAGINDKAYKTLIDRKGVVNRNWAFQTEDLQDLIQETKINFKKKFTDHLPTCMGSDPHYPINQDLPEYYAIVRQLVNDMIRIMYEAPAFTSAQGSSEKPTPENEKYYDARLQRNIDNDEDLQEFLTEIANGLELHRRSDLETFDDIVEVVTSLICSVTGMHELVGQISDYFAHPKVCGTTLRTGKEIDSVQIYQLNCTLVSSTGLRMPRLMGNWEHLLTRHHFADETVLVMRKFQESLRELSMKIEKANESRKFKFMSFNPSRLESSVSV